MKLWTFLFLLNIYGSAIASSDIKVQIPKSQCSDTDIRTQNPSLKEHFSRPRSQDSIGWCYGFAAADLLSVELGVPVSATHASAIYNDNVQKNFFWRLGYGIAEKFNPGNLGDTYEGGFIGKALKAMRKEGSVCREEDFPFDGDYWQEIMPMIEDLEFIKSGINTKEAAAVTQTCNSIDFFKSMNPLMSIENSELFTILQGNNINTAFAEIIEAQCKDKLISVKDNLKIKTKSRPRLSRSTDERGVERFKKRAEKYFETINSTLEAGKPIGVEYNVKHITDRSGGHASVLMGRRWKDGVCQYQIRNSWGESCLGYNISKIAGCDRSEGAYWVTDQKFYEMVSNIIYISN